MNPSIYILFNLRVTLLSAFDKATSLSDYNHLTEEEEEEVFITKLHKR